MERRRLRKKDKRLDEIFKEAILNYKNEDDSKEHDEGERNAFEMLE